MRYTLTKVSIPEEIVEPDADTLKAANEIMSNPAQWYHITGLDDNLLDYLEFLSIEDELIEFTFYETIDERVFISYEPRSNQQAEPVSDD